MLVTGGENVYSTEVEAVLYAHPAIKEAVIGIPDPQWGELLTACVVVKEASSVAGRGDRQPLPPAPGQLQNPPPGGILPNRVAQERHGKNPQTRAARACLEGSIKGREANPEFPPKN
jgi:hypothetical protein